MLHLAGKDLLFGILAVQMNFISPAQLNDAMNARIDKKPKRIGELLLELGHISAAKMNLLEQLVDEHVEGHNGDPQKSLAALAMTSMVVKDFQTIADPGIRSCLGSLDRTIEYSSCDIASEWLPSNTGPVDRTASRFQILRQHAKGGLGEVFVARDLELEREVALKEIQSQHASNESSRARFVVEAQVTGNLEHPGIVPVYGLGYYPDGRPFYAMRFVHGESLAEAIDEFHKRDWTHDDSGRTLQFRKLLNHFVDVCQAIEYAHHRGVLHRDLKPGNVMLGKYGETLVVDWGLARVRNQADEIKRNSAFPMKLSSASLSNLTQIGSVIGTPAFMSPEQAAGNLDDLGPSTDIYSLGATLFVLLSGKPPIDGKDLGEIVRKIQCGEIRSLRSINPMIPRPLEAICLKALAPQKCDRYESCADLADDLEKWLADETVKAYPEPIASRIRRWARKHPAAISSAAATLLVGLTSSLIVASLISGKNRELVDVNAQLQKSNSDLVAERDKSRRSESEAMIQRDIAQKQKEKANANERIAINREKQAKEKQAEASAVLSYFQRNVLSANRPEGQNGGLGKDISLNQAIEAAIPNIASSFKNQPIVEAQVRQTIGNSFAYVGDYERSLEQLTIADELFRKTIGVEQPLTLLCMSDIGTVLYYLGRFDKALSIREEALRRLKASVGPSHLFTLRGISNLANSYESVGLVDKALELREETLNQGLKELGSSHPETLSNMYNLALSYASKGRNQDALELCERVFKESKHRLGPKHPDTLRYMNGLSMCYDKVGKTLQAMETLEDAVKSSKEILGIEHVDTLATLKNLAACYNSAGRKEDALKIRESNFKVYSAKRGLDDSNTFESMRSLSAAYQGVSRYQDARKLLQASLHSLKTKLGATHSKTVTICNDLAALEMRFASRLEAKRLLKEQADLLDNVTPGQREDIHSLIASGQTYCNLSLLCTDPLESLTWISKAIPIFERGHVLAPNNVTCRQYLRNARISCAIFMEQTNRFADADTQWSAASKLSNSNEIKKLAEIMEFWQKKRVSPSPSSLKPPKS